jgi:hypothetical protein
MFPPKLSTPGTKPEPEVRQQPVAEAPSAPERGKAVISPEMVAFRMGDEKCGNCMNMDANSHCSVIDMDVQPDDSCQAFAQRDDAGQDFGDAAPQPEMQPQ